MAVPTYTVRCIKKEIIARNVYEIRFERPEGFDYKAGQFILFDVPHPDNPDDIQARAYSIASAPHEKELIFVVKLIPGGRFSRWLVERMDTGSSIVMKGPFGNFVLKDDDDRPLLLVCTSAGNAPFRGFLLDLIEKRSTKTVDLLYGVRSEEDLFWEEEFESIATTYPSLNLHITLSQPSGTWTGLRGRVQSHLPDIIPDITNRSVYACGNPDMTKELKELCVKQWGMDRKHVHIEGFI